jgi:hypothetical protein
MPKQRQEFTDVSWFERVETQQIREGEFVPLESRELRFAQFARLPDEPVLLVDIEIVQQFADGSLTLPVRSLSSFQRLSYAASRDSDVSPASSASTATSAAISADSFRVESLTEQRVDAGDGVADGHHPVDGAFVDGVVRDDLPRVDLPDPIDLPPRIALNPPVDVLVHRAAAGGAFLVEVVDPTDARLEDAVAGGGRPGVSAGRVGVIGAEDHGVGIEPTLRLVLLADAPLSVSSVERPEPPAGDGCGSGRVDDEVRRGLTLVTSFPTGRQLSGRPSGAAPALGPRSVQRPVRDGERVRYDTPSLSR